MIKLDIIVTILSVSTAGVSGTPTDGGIKKYHCQKKVIGANRVGLEIQWVYLLAYLELLLQWI